MLSFVDKLDEYTEYFKYITDAGKTILKTAPDTVREICDLEFNRAVFLGNGSNYGTAIESHLKLQELTAGAVMCAYDTFPGLRHGPEAVINEDTLVVAYVSSSGFTKKYELDLLKEIREKKIGRALLVVCDSIDDEISGLADYIIDYDPDRSRNIDDDLLPPVFIIVGQLLGLFKSIKLGYMPDTPSETGIIHRVVKGVKVYNPLHYNQSGIFDIVSER
jgi:tagatose-6-phosphate ketose/aldose isomerase